MFITIVVSTGFQTGLNIFICVVSLLFKDNFLFKGTKVADTNSGNGSSALCKMGANAVLYSKIGIKYSI